jgi:hypothetical protein
MTPDGLRHRHARAGLVDVVNQLPVDLEIHDAIICATAGVCARETGEPPKVMTRDAAITASGFVETIW